MVYCIGTLELFSEMFKTLAKLLFLLLISNLVYAQNNLKSPNSVSIGLTHAPPMIYITDGKEPSGMIVDFLKEIGQRENWQIQWKTGTWSEIYEKARTGEIDIMTFIAFSQERMNYFNFSKEIFITGWGQVYVNEDNDLRNVLDFDNKPIAVVKDDIHSTGIQEMCEKFKVNCLIEYVANYDVAFEKLVNNEVAGAVSGSIVGVTYERKYDIVRSSVMFNPTNAHFAVSKNNGNTKLLDAIDSYMRSWKDDPLSPYTKLRNKWLSTSQGIIIPTWIKYGFAIAVLLVIAFLINLYYLKRQIRKHTHQHINQSKQLKQIINLVPHIIYVKDEAENFNLVNNNAADFFDVKSDDATPIPKPRKDNPSFTDFFEGDERLIEQGKRTVFKEITTYKNGEKKVFNLSKVPLLTEDDIPAVLTVAVDVSEEKKYLEKINYMAHHDELTQLPNRELLKNRVVLELKQEVSNKYQNALLFIDLDYFKNVNDSLGHAAGDQLLRIISERLKSIVSSKDTVARIGGDEFILLLKTEYENYSDIYEHANEVAHSALESLTEKIVINRHDLFITASIGIIIFPYHARTYEEVMQKADIAMYQAKARGRNGIAVFEPKMYEDILRHHQLVSDLHKSLETMDFYIQYQPQMSGAKADFIGLEALIRWNSDKEKIYSTSDFIRAAEESGLIIPISYWVIEQVIIQLQKWSETYKQLPFVTINISVLQLHDDDIVKYLNYLLRKYKIPPSLIELEITESVLVDKVRETVNTLEKLRDLGIRLAIDDFGTGYSSLSYLKKLPFDKLKIDYSFVKDIVENSEARTIVRTIIGMAEDLSLEVIAEGVETKEQHHMLLEMGCDKFQGYYFDRPLLADYIEEKYLANSNSR